MKFLKSAKGQFSFQIDHKEKAILFKLLEAYPLVPAAHLRLSKTESRPEDQQLLEDSLAGQRKENREQVERMLKAKSRFRPNKNGFRFSLKAPQLEWLLQVLNDIRVGSWLGLGSPDGPAETLAALNDQTAPYLWALELSGYFQMMLLMATHPDAPPAEPSAPPSSSQ